jgi:hypothetical protein
MGFSLNCFNLNSEVFEKFSMLLYFKAGIHEVFRGLIRPLYGGVTNAEIGQKGMFFNGLSFLLTSLDWMVR